MQDLKQTSPFPWQQKPWTYLLERCRKQQLAHALLFIGQPGLGKSLFAQSFAEILLCDENDNFTAACKACSSCYLIRAGSHPDLHFVRPGDSSQSIKIEQIRALIDQINQTPQQSNCKVVILSLAETLSSSASHSLLKILEEPTPKTFFILITERPGLLLPTIRSRCQAVTFLPPALETAALWLAGQSVKGDHDLLLALASGAPLAACEIKESLERLALFKSLERLTVHQEDPVQLAQQWLKADIHHFLRWFVTGVYDMIRLRVGLGHQELMNRDSLACLQQLASRVTLPALFSYLDKLYLTMKQLSVSHRNQQLLVEDLFCSWCAQLEVPSHAR